MKNIMMRILFIIIGFLVLETLLILALEAVYTLSEYKLNITTDLYIENVTNVFNNLGSYIQTNWEQKNPFFLIGTGVIALYSIYTPFANKKKKGWETEIDNAYHDSACWAKAREIVDREKKRVVIYVSDKIIRKIKNDYIIQPTNSRTNRNIMVVGGPGSYKTQGFVITNVLNETENSIVVTDPKGEVYENTADFKRKQ